MAILVTGGNGKIGTKLLESLSDKRDLLCFSRNKPQIDVHYVKGNFYSFEDLSKLDAYSIDTVVHLAAIQGGHSEEETLDLNITGTRKLFRYLIDRGCKRFITASSIAAVGCLDRNFVPLQLPIPDELETLKKLLEAICEQEFLEGRRRGRRKLRSDRRRDTARRVMQSFA